MMNTRAYICSEMCPVGCGEVIFLQGRKNSVICCFCTGCSIAYNHPSKTQFEEGLNELISLKDLSPEGVIFPKIDAITEAGFDRWIIRSIKVEEFGYTEDELNNFA